MKYVLAAVLVIVTFFVLSFVYDRWMVKPQPQPTPQVKEIPTTPRWTPDSEEYGKG